MTRIAACSVLLALLGTGASTALADEEASQPSAEFLEFLAEFEDVDDETFELLVEHGVRDQEKEQNDD